MSKIIKLKTAALVLATAMFTGCTSVNSNYKGNDKTIVEELNLQKVTLGQCRKLEQSHNYSEAMKRYVELLSQNRGDRMLFEEGTLGKARAFLGMKKYTYALNAISPLPETAKKDYDRRKLALAGEIMLANSMFESAEPVLELALSDLSERHEADFAAAFANLGTIYFKNYKLAQGITMYEKASKGYRNAGNYTKMMECEKIVKSFKRFTSTIDNK